MRVFRHVAVPALLLSVALASPAQAWIRSPATTFATLPGDATGPEGLAVDGQGNVYVTTFGFNAGGPVPGPGQLFVFAPSGTLIRQVGVSGSSAHLLGLAFHPSGALLVVDFGSAQVLRVDPVTGASAVFMTVPQGGAGLNALTFDGAGNVYVSDSFLGIVWRTGPAGGVASQWVKHKLLRTRGVPPFGANGLAFNRAGTTLYVANTGADTVVKIPVVKGTSGKPEVFVHAINGADGLLVDALDNIWVAANQADEILVLDPSGRVVAKLGDFEGIDPHGAPRGLLFPASIAFGGQFVYVTNLALDLRLFGLPQPVDAQWTAQVTRYTVSRIRAHIPPLPGRP